MNLRQLAPVGTLLVGMAAWGGLAAYDVQSREKSAPPASARFHDGPFLGFPIDRSYGAEAEGGGVWPEDIGESEENPAQEWAVDLQTKSKRFAVWFEGESLCWATQAGPRCVEGR